MNEIRTYMSFTTPVDPAKIETIPDMDMSYALAATLVEWGPDKQISAALAEKWTQVDDNTVRFTLRRNAKWSDGKAVTSNDIKKSLERGFKAHPIDLRSLELMLSSIECPSATEIDLKLKPRVTLERLLGKLTEPNYGILKAGSNGAIDLSITTGPFLLTALGEGELTMNQNSYWHGKQEGMPDRVVIRKPAETVDAETVLLKDQWPNLIETSSLINKDTLSRYKSEKYEIRQRPLDKFFHMALGKRLVNADGRQLLGFLQENTNSSDFTTGLSGFAEATQFFPIGYQLHDPAFKAMEKTGIKLPEKFKTRPIEILISSARVSEALRKNIQRAITNATGVEPKFIYTSLESLRAKKIEGNYDLYAGTVGLADPDPEGAMSYYLEGEAPIIPTSDNDFLKRLDAARKQANAEKKLTEMRSILKDAVCKHYLMALFHVSTVGIARPKLDLSHIPQSDESVTLSKVRFRGSK